MPHSKYAQLALCTGALLLLLRLCAAAAVPTYKQERTKLPAFVRICRRSDAELSSCARRSLNGLKEYLNGGIPELFIPPIEPLVIPEIKMAQDSGAIYLHSTYRDVHIHGLSNFTLNELNIDPAKLKLSMSTSFPNVTLHALYEMKGKIMMMPLSGEGACQANFTDVSLTTVILAEQYKKHGRPYIRVKNIKMTYGLGNAEVRLDNLFNGDKALGERMNTFLNENWESLSEEIQPLLQNAMVEVVRSSTDKLFDKYSYDDLMPE